MHVVTARKAFCLLCKETAEVVSVEDGVYRAYDFEGWLHHSDVRATSGQQLPDEDWIRTVNFALQVPRIVRLLEYDRIPGNAVKFSRRNVFLRDDYSCQYCGRRHSTSGLSLDHVVPRSRGGETSWANIVTACLKCNVRKGGRTPREANMKLLSQPVRPHRNPVFSQQLASEKYECWRVFVR